MIYRAGLVCLFIIVVCSSCASKQRTKFYGWDNCYRLCNGKVEAIINPQIGRMISFRTTTGQNVLAVNRKMLGCVPPAGSPDFVFFGGLYTWISPQSHWVPFDGTNTYVGADPALDRGPFRVTYCSDTELTMLSPASWGYGLQIEKTFRLVKDQPRMEFIVTLHNIGFQPVRWGIWNLSAVPPTGVVFFDVPHGKRDIKYPGDSDDQTKWMSSVVRLVNKKVAAVDLRRYKFKGAKLWVSPGSDYLACRQPGSWFIRRFSTDPKSGFYTDWYSQVEIWADAKENHIFELEVLSPDSVIAAGKSVSWSESFYVVDEKSPIAKNLAVEAAKIPSLLKNVSRESLFSSDLGDAK